MAGTENKKQPRMKDYRQAQIVRLDIISELYKKGNSYRDIRREVMTRLNLECYSLQTVHKDVQRLLEEWRKERLDNTDQALQLELTRIDDLVKEAWAAWEKSKTDYTQKTAKQKGLPSTDEGGNDEIITVQLEQGSKEFVCTGDPRYLELINKLLIERRKLLGLYAPEKKELSGNLSFANLLMQTGLVDEDNGE